MHANNLDKLIAGVCIEYSQSYPSAGLVVPAALLHPPQPLQMLAPLGTLRGRSAQS
jgi:hypothetical protein